MDRLTEKQSAGYDLKALNGEWCNHYCHKQKVETCTECAIYEAIQRLAYYEDLEEKGRLIIDGERINPKLTLEDLKQLENKFIWWDNFGGMHCQCKKGFVVTEAGTFSFDFVLSNGSAYLRKPDASR